MTSTVITLTAGSSGAVSGYGNGDIAAYSQSIFGGIWPNNVDGNFIAALGFTFAAANASTVDIFIEYTTSTPPLDAYVGGLSFVGDTGTFTLATTGLTTSLITGISGRKYKRWSWTGSGVLPAQTNPFTNGRLYSTTVATVLPTPAAASAGKGDITNPNSWEDLTGHIPPLQFSAVPANTNYPQNGDGRYWFSSNAQTTDVNDPISFIGDTTFLADTICLQWSVTQVSTDGSTLLIAYSVDNGATYVATTVLPQTQLKGLQNGQIVISLAGSTGLKVKSYSTGGTPSTTAIKNTVAIAITRNVNEGLTWDSPNPFDPVNYNAQCMDDTTKTDTLANLRKRILIRLGFSNQSSNPPPGMTILVNDFLSSAQTYLYRRYMQLHTRRMFRWKVNPGQRFYSLKDNDEDVLCNYLLDPNKSIEWAGIQDNRNVWYPLIQGIPPQLYTMIDKPWRPARYDIRQAIELYPAPDQTYWLWIRGHFGLRAFASDNDLTTLDCELVFLHALANAKSHYGQPDANNIEAQANAYRAELIAGTHQTAHYVPGTIAVPPAVRPTLIQFNEGNNG